MNKATGILTVEARDRDVNLALDDSYIDAMASALSDILGDTYTLVVKNHLYHWNVVGPLFKPLHDLTEEHYNKLFAATDTIAERVRALGHLAPAKLGDAAKFSPKARDVQHLSAIDMVNDLIADHEAAVGKIRDAAIKAGDANDKVTEDMLTQCLAFHEKALWMLRATVSE